LQVIDTHLGISSFRLFVRHADSHVPLAQKSIDNADPFLTYVPPLRILGITITWLKTFTACNPKIEGIEEEFNGVSSYRSIATG